MRRPALLTLAALLLAWLGWWLAGWAASAIGLGELEPLARAGGVFAAVTLAELAQARLIAH